MIEIQVAFVACLVTVVLAFIVASLVLFPQLFTPRCIICREPLKDQELDLYLITVEEPMIAYAGICDQCLRCRSLGAPGRT